MSHDQTFDSALGNYGTFGTATVEWVGDNGNPNPGCVHFADSVGDSAWIINDTDTTLLGANYHFYVNWRVDFSPTTSHPGDMVVTFTAFFEDNAGDFSESIAYDDVTPGWHQHESAVLSLAFGDMIGFRVAFGGTIELANEANVYIDTIHIGDTPPPITTSTFELTHSAGGMPGSVML